MLDKLNKFEHVYLTSGLSREEVQYFMLMSDVGLALYGDYSWSRLNDLHGSSLKYFEYLINEL